MREISKRDFIQGVKQICREAHYILPDDLVALLETSRDQENNPIAIDVLSTIIENASLAESKSRPLCQDTGVGIFFVELGDNVVVEGGHITENISRAMQEVYQDDFFRKSVVKDPLFNRSNTGNNLPPLIHWEVVPGDQIKITFLPKGAGAENMSCLKMFHPLAEPSQIIDFVVETVRNAGGNPCPPLIIGIGVGGSFDYASILAKKALLLPLNEEDPDPEWAFLEREILDNVNRLGIGPMGLGGQTTALKVRVNHHPCHTASLPVAVNLQCHSHRHREILL